MAAQFFSSLADNALLIAAVAILKEMSQPGWMHPLLKLFFVISYVALAAFVGAFADSMPKGRVMFITNTIKVVGCLSMFWLHPLLAYALVGLGAAAYSPAKYGILTELLPPTQLVQANAWIEVTTVGSIVAGTALGGMLVSQKVSNMLLGIDLPAFETGIDSPAEAAMLIIMCFYALAAWLNLYIPRTGVDHRIPSVRPIALLRDFGHCVALLWRDKLGRISLATTTLFWGAGAALQFILLKWAEDVLGLSLAQATFLQLVTSGGLLLGAVMAGRLVTLRGAVKVLPLGALMGLGAMALAVITSLQVAVVAIVFVGMMAAFLLVPMNALLQHRGHVLMGAGHSIAVQNFNENACILLMQGGYAMLLWLGLSIQSVCLLFGGFVALTMLGVQYMYRRTCTESDLQHLVPSEGGHH